MTYPETRIVLRSPDGIADVIARHPGQPANYAHPDGTLWRWEHDDAWQDFGGARLRCLRHLRHPAPP